jgi:hypothetical protein
VREQAQRKKQMEMLRRLENHVALHSEQSSTLKLENERDRESFSRFEMRELSLNKDLDGLAAEQNELKLRKLKDCKQYLSRHIERFWRKQMIEKKETTSILDNLEEDNKEEKEVVMQEVDAS